MRWPDNCHFTRWTCRRCTCSAMVSHRLVQQSLNLDHLLTKFMLNPFPPYRLLVIQVDSTRLLVCYSARVAHRSLLVLTLCLSWHSSSLINHTNLYSFGRLFLHLPTSFTCAGREVGRRQSLGICGKYIYAPCLCHRGTLSLAWKRQEPRSGSEL